MEQNRKWEFVDSTGRVVIAPQFDGARHFIAGIAPVRQGGKWGCIDKTGRMIVEPQWESWLPFMEGVAAVRRDGKLGFLNKRGGVMIEPGWDVMEDYQETRRDKDPETLWLLLARREHNGVIAAWFDATGKKIWSSDQL